MTFMSRFFSPLAHHRKETESSTAVASEPASKAKNAAELCILLDIAEATQSIGDLFLSALPVARNPRDLFLQQPLS